MIFSEENPDRIICFNDISKCLTSMCAAWRWFKKEKGTGYCGLAGKPIKATQQDLIKMMEIIKEAQTFKNTIINKNNSKDYLNSIIEGTYKILPDGLIDVIGNVDLNEKGLTKIPFKFSKVSGSFVCYNNRLTSLQGAPKTVGSSFLCFNNKLTSLQGAPREVGENFLCYNNQLTSLQGAPEKVGGDFACSYNQLTSLQGAPREVGRDFHCYSNQLTSLDGKPEKIGGKFIYCPENPICQK